MARPPLPREIDIADLPRLGDIVIVNGRRYFVTSLAVSEDRQAKRDRPLPPTFFTYRIVASDNPEAEPGPGLMY